MGETLHGSCLKTFMDHFRSHLDCCRHLPPILENERGHGRKTSRKSSIPSTCSFCSTSMDSRHSQMEISLCSKTNLGLEKTVSNENVSTFKPNRRGSAQSVSSYKAESAKSVSFNVIPKEEDELDLEMPDYVNEQLSKSFMTYLQRRMGSLSIDKESSQLFKQNLLSTSMESFNAQCIPEIQVTLDDTNENGTQEIKTQERKNSNFGSSEYLTSQPGDTGSRLSDCQKAYSVDNIPFITDNTSRLSFPLRSDMSTSSGNVSLDFSGFNSNLDVTGGSLSESLIDFLSSEMDYLEVSSVFEERSCKPPMKRQSSDSGSAPSLKVTDKALSASNVELSHRIPYSCDKHANGVMTQNLVKSVSERAVNTCSCEHPIDSKLKNLIKENVLQFAESSRVKYLREVYARSRKGRQKVVSDENLPNSSTDHRKCLRRKLEKTRSVSASDVHHVTTKENDNGGGQMVTEALEHYEQKEKYDSPTGLPDFRLKRDAAKMKGRRELRAMRQMSTPQPIKLRLERSPPTKKASHIVRRSHMQRSRSAPDLVDGVKKTKRFAFQVGSAHAGDLAIQMSRFTYEDDDDTSEDAVSWGGASESSSVSSAGKHALLEEIFEEQPVYVEALWHHVTMDPEELGFRAGDVIQVTDMADKDWWWGNLDKREGWFPASFVRLRANQDITVDDLAQKVKDGSWDSHRLLQQYNNGVLSKDQARTNVVNEIMSAEREYVKGLNDVVQGFVEKSRGRPEMFPEDRLALIYCNIEAICKFSEKLLADLEQAFNAEQPEQSQLGHVFLKHKSGFEIYSDYCNNHPQACEELRMLQQHLKYQHFFEGCRVLQKMKEIPLEGFLLTPVQKICKYPLQLAELLKYTKTGHPDYQQLQAALGSMKSIAMMINERKRKLESIEKLEQWQASVQDWEGAELLERSSELIHQGDLTKINSSGWSQERSFFLFDHQLIYCKKLDSLWRYGLIYKGRIDLDNCEITSIDDGKDPQLNVTIRHGWKIQDKSRDKRFLLCASSKEEKEKWLASFKHERKTIEQDEAAGFNLEEYRKKAMKIQNYRISNHPSKDKSGKSKTLQAVYGNSPEALQAFHSPGGTVSRGSDGLLYTPHPRKTKRGILGFIRRTRP